MITVKIDQKDIQKAISRIRWYGQKVQTDVQIGIQRTAFDVQRNAKQNAPVGTPESTGIKGYAGGRLRADIQQRVLAFDGRVFNTVHYAPYVELGTYKMSAQPYLFPAWEANRRRYIQRMREALKL